MKVKKGAKHITLPLKSARILPSSYKIPCTIENGDTIVFILDRPEKVAVVANYDEAWKVFAEKGVGHVPIQNWDSDYAKEKERASYHGANLSGSLSEGYKNPLIILAHGPEQEVPDRNASTTLVIHPNDKVSQAQLHQYDTLWFAPGVHDLSQFGDPLRHQTLIKGGQTVYLEGGSYVMARFKKSE